jgi:hypothetical protein
MESGCSKLSLTEFQDFSVDWLVKRHLRSLLKFTNCRFSFIVRFRWPVFSLAHDGDGTNFPMMSIRRQNQPLSNKRLETDLRIRAQRSRAVASQPNRYVGNESDG